MASYTILKDQELVVNLPDDYSDQGWEVSENIAYHSGCNPGEISLSVNLFTNSNWTFKYEILTLESGTVNIIVDGVAGILWDTPGEKTETFNSSNPAAVIKFFATGKTSIKFLQIYPTLDLSVGTTIAFNEDANKWVSYFSYIPEFMCKFIDDFFAFKNGAIWQQNVNPIRNNFFGVQYTSKISFYVNLSPTEVKSYFSMRQKSNSVWSAENNGDIYIYPTEGKPDGQSSRLKKGRFRNLQGDWFADFLRDLSDPRFVTEEEALFKGAQLQGNVMKVTLENTSTTEIRLFSIDVTVSNQNYTY